MSLSESQVLVTPGTEAASHRQEARWLQATVPSTGGHVRGAPQGATAGLLTVTRRQGIHVPCVVGASPDPAENARSQQIANGGDPPDRLQQDREVEDLPAGFGLRRGAR